MFKATYHYKSTFCFETTICVKAIFCLEWEKANPEVAAAIDGAVFVADSTHLGFGVFKQNVHLNKFMF